MAKKYSGKEFKKITLEDMVTFISENCPEDKAWFKKVAYQNKNGDKVNKYNHLNAVREFCKRYAPELIPEAKPKAPRASTVLADW